jgi:hypothetical protein
MLTPDQMVQLTGYRKPSKQIEWLKRNGVPYLVNAAGYPVVIEVLNKRAVSEVELGPVP